MSAARFCAEVSSNHDASLERSLAFVDAAAEAGCASVKFQQFRIDRLFAPEALRHDPTLAARRAWELPEAFNAPLAERARERGLAYSSTPFYLEAVALLEPLVSFFKVASYQILWLDLLREVGRTGKPVVLSTGMATEEEVERALATLAEAGAGQLTLLHCVSLYPTPVELANLAAIDGLRERFDLPVGLSDHSANPAVVERAVRHFGAAEVELHLDLEGEGAEYAAGHCWLPGDLWTLIDALSRPRELPASHPADGDGSLGPRPEEDHERRWRTDPSDGLRPLLATRRGL